MHLVILSTPRAGSHMLRSMLRADPRVDDLGAFIFPDDGRVVDPPPTGSAADVQAVYEREIKARPGRILVSHIKLMHGHFEAIRAAERTGGKFVLLHRRDRLAQACSFLLAARYGCFRSAAPEGATIAPSRERVAELVAAFEKGDRLARLYLEGLPSVDLAYEDVTAERVAAVLHDLTGITFAAGEPTTTKSAPRLADYVANLPELVQTI